MEEAEKGAYGLGTGIFLKECSATPELCSTATSRVADPAWVTLWVGPQTGGAPNRMLSHDSAHRDLTAWLGMSDSNSGIRARAMYLRYRDNSCWLGQKSPAETIPV
jgi:hypothetical protein